MGRIPIENLINRIKLRKNLNTMTMNTLESLQNIIKSKKKLVTNLKTKRKIDIEDLVLKKSKKNQSLLRKVPRLKRVKNALEKMTLKILQAILILKKREL